jgi:hypothetical protein
MKKILYSIKRAICDLFYMFGLWIIIRFNPEDGGELLKKWCRNLQQKYSIAKKMKNKHIFTKKEMEKFKNNLKNNI